MCACVQRVRRGSVTVDGQITGQIQRGFVVLLGVADDDTETDLRYLADKVINLRVFEDDEGKMNRSLREVNGQLLVVSQFTLLGDCRKGAAPRSSTQLHPTWQTKCTNSSSPTSASRAHMLKPGSFKR